MVFHAKIINTRYVLTKGEIMFLFIYLFIYVDEVYN